MAPNLILCSGEPLTGAPEFVKSIRSWPRLGAYTSKEPCTPEGCRALSLRVNGVLNLPLHQPRVDPEGVDAQGDDAQEKPFDPKPEDAPPGAHEPKLSAVKIRVLGPPPFDQDNGERIADPEGADRYQDAQDLRAEKGRSPSAELVDLDAGDGSGAGARQGAWAGGRHLPVWRNFFIVDAQGFPQWIVRKCTVEL